ncbi:MAG: hypothetical protein M1828_005062 [Chrysothrix sp. TS-e1954]|nr:MAG: hypothetical protein M1828_005062 [Chrysothrix sp. TS-e1954]
MVRLVEVIGSLNIDLVTQTPRIPGPGETLRASSFSTGFGGKGANQAVACARLLPPSSGHGADRVCMLGALGSDQFGKDFREQLKKEGIDATGVLKKEHEKTGSTVIIVEENTGENRILFTPAANDRLRPEDIELADRRGGLVLLQLEIPLETVTDALRAAKASGKETVLNPAPAVPLPDEVYQLTTHLILNETEACVLSGIRSEELVASLDKAAEHFFMKGVHTVVITLGAQGVFWRTSSNAKDADVGEIVSARTIANVVDTTGAGDTFCGAYAAQLSQTSGSSTKDDIKAAIAFANKAASISVQRHGAQSSMPSRAEVDGLH